LICRPSPTGPYGEERQDPAANDNDESFTGHIRDEDTGLIYAQARYMDPVIGRFLSGDPVGFSADAPQMFNRYSYTFNDPVNAFDPTGEYPLRPSDPRYQFAIGFYEGATGMFTAYSLSQGIKQGDPKSLWIATGMAVGGQLALANKSKAARLAVDSMSKNIPRVAGRTAGGAATSLAGSKGVGALFSKLGAGKFTIAAGGLSIGVTNFSTGQIAAATTALGGLYNSISEAGYDPGNVSLETLGGSALISAAGGDLSFNAKTGAIAATLPAKTGSRLGERVIIGTIEGKREP
jgi:RHS repeat-associated protein